MFFSLIFSACMMERIFRVTCPALAGQENKLYTGLRVFDDLTLRREAATNLG